MSIISDTLSVVLAGGAGTRLAPLTDDRAKPAVPFGGQYRIIDFTLSNCLHSGLRRILVFTQYKSNSLHRHLRDAWSVFSPELNEYVVAIPPQLRTGDSWYSGTADAIYQNLCEIRNCDVEYVLILSGDHVYRMNYSAMLESHRKSGADVSVACMEVALNEARSFGVMSVDSQQRIRRFAEKPEQPEPTPDNPRMALASMGIYVFSKDVLCRELERDNKDNTSSHDFGKDLLPRLIHSHRVVGYRYRESRTGAATEGYWRDVGTIDAFDQANMDLLKDQPPLNLYAEDWPIRKHELPAPPSRIDRDVLGVSGVVVDSMLSNGVVVSGGTVCRSILSPNVRIGSGATVEDSILFEGVRVGDGARLRNCIVDKGVRIPAGETVGIQPSIDSKRFFVSENGVVVIPRKAPFDRDVSRRSIPTAHTRFDGSLINVRR